jgi:Abortive infection alpha
VTIDGTGEIIKSGAMANLTDLLKTLAGPAFEELGAILADHVRVYRVKNLLRTTEKTKRILLDAGLPPNPVPTRLLLPILDACSVEDNDDLQERWAGLLASASQEADSLSPSFIETLKQLTPSEAKHYDHIFVEVSKLYKGNLTGDDPIPHQAFTDAWKAPKGVVETYERLGLVRRDYDVEVKSGSWRITYDVKNLKSTVEEIENALDEMEAEVRYRHFCTAYGLSFLNACRGPRKQKQHSANDAANIDL